MINPLHILTKIVTCNFWWGWGGGKINVCQGIKYHKFYLITNDRKGLDFCWMCQGYWRSCTHIEISRQFILSEFDLKISLGNETTYPDEWSQMTCCHLQENMESVLIFGLMTRFHLGVVSQIRKHPPPPHRVNDKTKHLTLSDKFFWVQSKTFLPNN